MTQHVLSLSYGKDSIACIEACRQLGYPIGRIIHAEVWATDTIPADLPPMVEFKTKADAIIKKRYGLTVEHICATREDREETLMRGSSILTYERMFYTIPKRRKYPQHGGEVTGFPMLGKPWCNSKLKVNPINKSVFSKRSLAQGADTNIVQYLGIAADEPERIRRHTKPGIVLPLVDIGWDEAYCRKWCEDNDLLSPIYTTEARGGCWFCHNQRVDQLRILRTSYPELWSLLLKWDKDSPVTFKADGHTVHDYDKRFAAEEKGFVPTDRRFRWKMLEKFENKEVA